MHRTPYKLGFATDSPLEGGGFELPVPRLRNWEIRDEPGPFSFTNDGSSVLPFARRCSRRDGLADRQGSARSHRPGPGAIARISASTSAFGRSASRSSKEAVTYSPFRSLRALIRSTSSISRCRASSTRNGLPSLLACSFTTVSFQPILVLA